MLYEKDKVLYICVRNWKKLKSFSVLKKLDGSLFLIMILFVVKCVRFPGAFCHFLTLTCSSHSSLERSSVNIYRTLSFSAQQQKITSVKGFRLAL